MTSFLINIDTLEKEVNLKKLAKQLQIPLIKLSDTQKEDIGLGYLMHKANRTKTVSKEKVLKKLKAKCS
jgi:Fe2+ transport system protein B